jgi:hypothetical protein
MVRWLGVVLALAVVFFVGCGKKEKVAEKVAPNEVASSKVAPNVDQRDLSPAKRKVLDCFRTASVLVENGQAAVIKIPDGYMFIIPTKTDLDNGHYRILFSQSGTFRNDGKVVADGEPFGMNLEVKGHGIRFTGGSRTSVYVGLFMGDESASIAMHPGADPNALDVTSLKFQENPAWDEKAFKEVFLEELKKIQKK